MALVGAVEPAAVIVLGIDPGFAFVGLAVVEMTASRARVLFAETFKTSRASGADEDRLDAIFDRLLDVIDDRGPAVVGYENQAGVEAGKAKRILEDPSAVGEINASSRRVHEVTGAIRCAARVYGLPCYAVAPSSVKLALLGKGGGRASKSAVKAAVARYLGGVGLSEHAADGAAVAVATSRRHALEMAKRRSHMRLIS